MLEEIQKQWSHSISLKEVEFSSGEKINRIAFLGSEMVRLRESRIKNNKKVKWTIGIRLMDILDELAKLGAELDSDGFVVSK